MEMSIIPAVIIFIAGYVMGRLTRFEISLKDVYTLDKEPPPAIPVPRSIRNILDKKDAQKARIVSPRKRIDNDLSSLDETNFNDND